MTDVEERGLFIGGNEAWTCAGAALCNDGDVPYHARVPVGNAPIRNGPGCGEEHEEPRRTPRQKVVAVRSSVDRVRERVKRVVLVQ